MRSVCLFIGLLATGSAGCRPEKPIEVQTFPKPPDLMLVGITVRGDSIWSIKLVNDREKILAAEDTVYQFAQSMDFSTDPANPSWTVPDNWKDLEIQNAFRKATFEIDDAKAATDRTQVVISEIRMGQRDSSVRDTIVANINRWRKEMNAEEVINYTVNSEGRAIEKSAASLVVPFMKKVDVSGQPMYFDKIPGVFQKKSRPAPFMQGMDGSGLSTGLTDPAKSSPPPPAGENQPAENGTAGTSTPGEPEAAITDLPFEFEKPDDWQLVGSNSVVIARFLVGEGAEQAEVKVSRFAGSIESVNWSSTVTMWQQQFQVPVTPAEELPSVTDSLPVGEVTAQVIELSGQQDKSGTALLGAMIVDSTSEEKDKWFVKLQGPESTVKAQKSQFESFVKSIRFQAVQN